MKRPVLSFKQGIQTAELGAKFVGLANLTKDDRPLNSEQQPKIDLSSKNSTLCSIPSIARSPMSIFYVGKIKAINVRNIKALEVCSTFLSFDTALSSI